MGQAVPAEICYFCKDKVYVVERHTAEGLYFHRGCLKCDFCGSGLRIGGYAFQRTEAGEGNCLSLVYLKYNATSVIQHPIYQLSPLTKLA